MAKLITTIILNWNRSELLHKTLSSYFETVREPFEVIVVDNASTDDSRSVIARFPVENAIYLNENMGGEAINLAVQEAAGDLIHVSENDQIFLEGWPEHVRGSFDAFPSLGQLSLHGLVPSDDEAWEIKPGHLRFSRGRILYEAEGNVGTSSIIPATVFRQHGIVVHNLAQQGANAFKLPDDGCLSSDIKKLGLWCAWSDRYWVRNIGHEIAEFQRDPDYYRRNYDAKPALGIDGWQRRIAAASSRPRPKRHSVVFPGAELQPEKTPGDISGKPAQLWSMFDGDTAEVEVLDALYALTRLVKPLRAVETGTWLGRAAIAIASALRDNGFGHLISIEINPEPAAMAAAAIASAGLAEWADIVVGNSTAFQPSEELQFALLDSDTGLRPAEFRHFYENLAPGAVVAIHDTGPQHGGLADRVRELVNEGKLEGCFLQTPRGLFIGTTIRPPATPLTDQVLPPFGDAMHEVNALQARIAALEASTSWRITKPLRMVGDRLKARHGR